MSRLNGSLTYTLSREGLHLLLYITRMIIMIKIMIINDSNNDNDNDDLSLSNRPPLLTLQLCLE